MQVKKRDGTYQNFSQGKLLNGIIKACRHTKISNIQAEEIVSKICYDVCTLSIISSKEIGDRVMEHFKLLDPVAYIRFACEYIRFTDIDELSKYLKELKYSLSDSTNVSNILE